MAVPSGSLYRLLIPAPAGFGKTTLVSEWVASCGRPTAWSFGPFFIGLIAITVILTPLFKASRGSLFIT